MLPAVTIVFLVFNRRDKLRTSLTKMLAESDYPADRVDVIVVDNASTDGSADMVRAEFPQVRLVERAENVGVSGWNDGFAVATGDYVLALDDDCHLPGDGLRLAVERAAEHDADLVSFSVASGEAPEHLFTDDYQTGLLSFWGCAVLMRRRVLERLHGYDPEIFVWANELELMVRFFDAGFRHLHLPDVVAVHMKGVPGPWREHLRCYCFNARNFAYIAAKLLRPADAGAALVAVVATAVRDAVRLDRAALRAIPHALRGFVHGLRHRAPVRNDEVSHVYRHHLHSYAGPWVLARAPHQFLLAIPIGIARRVRPGYVDPRPADRGRRVQYMAERRRFYPDRAATLQLGERAAA